ncbi:MAG: hypothetical protein RMM58_11550 [Chloroflexota bacterium]|nr:hypothetical protein [Dehalococcoidia bacterium]MDW8254499.1 hypothetical protein [Chloroflexota bacterium]
MRIGFFPLLVCTLIVGVGAGGAAAYATSANRGAPTPVVGSVAPASQADSPTESSAAAQRQPGFPAGGQAAPGTGAQQGVGAARQPVSGDAAQGANRALTGAVTRIEGNQIVLTTPQGQTTVTVGEGTTVQRSVPASLADVKAGERVLVTARQTPDGSLAAVAIQIVGGN